MTAKCLDCQIGLKVTFAVELFELSFTAGLAGVFGRLGDDTLSSPSWNELIDAAPGEPSGFGVEG